MVNFEELRALARRCERGEGPTFALEGDIFEAVGGPLWDEAVQRAQEPCGCPLDTAISDAKLRAPEYATSLDAAVTLVPGMARWSMEQGDRFKATVHDRNALFKGDRFEATGSSHLPALALCAAALRARAHTETQGGE